MSHCSSDLLQCAFQEALNVIDPSLNFSLYNRIDWQDVSSIFTERRALLARWSFSIEKTVIERELAADIVSGFQSLDRMAPVLRRYRQLATVARSITVIGQPGSTVDLTGLNVVTLQPDDLLVKEWFLIVRHPDYNRALIAREVDEANHSFHGILTSDPAEVGRFCQALSLPERI
jgi:DICT domain-containing protein